MIGNLLHRFTQPFPHYLYHFPLGWCAAIMSGAEDYVVKPIEPKVLLARLQALLRRHHQPIQLKELVFGNLHLNIIQRVVVPFGFRIDLKPLE